MMESPDVQEITQQLSTRYNNVNVIDTGVASISGFPAQLYNVQYSVGTTSGEQWIRGVIFTTLTTPGLVWTISCGAMESTFEEAQKGYSHWQSEMVRFPTNLKILKK
jgi:hypothetical protein